MMADQAEKTAIEGYLSQARQVLETENILVYPSGTLEKPRVGVIYGDFPSRSAAQSEAAKLPAKIGQFRPYARSFPGHPRRPSPPQVLIWLEIAVAPIIP